MPERYGLFRGSPRMTWWLLALGLCASVSSDPGWSIVSSDNRDNKLFRHAFKSLARSVAVQDQNATLLTFDCNTGGWRKPALIQHVCRSHEFVFWVDSDIIVEPWFNLTGVKALMQRYPAVSILAGIDYAATQQRVREDPKAVYIDYFNAGAIVVRCERTELMTQWTHYARRLNLHSDQLPLQHMARPGSVFQPEIKYEFMHLGAYSASFRHYAGNYRSNWDAPSRGAYKLRAHTPCPLHFDPERPGRPGH